MNIKPVRGKIRDIEKELDSHIEEAESFFMNYGKINKSLRDKGFLDDHFEDYLESYISRKFPDSGIYNVEKSLSQDTINKYKSFFNKGKD